MKKTGAFLLSMILIFTMTVTNFAGAYDNAARVVAAENVEGGASEEGGTSAPEGNTPSPGAEDNTPPPASQEGAVISEMQNDPPASGGEDNTKAVPQGSTTPEQNNTNAVNPETNTQSSPDNTNSVNNADPQLSLTTTPENNAKSSSPDDTPAATERETSAAPQNTYSVSTFTVTFDANGHGTAPSAVTVTEGETLARPSDLSEEGFTFTGWYRDSAATTQWSFDIDTVSEN
ncbi:MAG: InlB B-repeat-containing protein, partial [Lachnospiraceae bacterium]|nr:InlB B-repeat-containing protein [Lachnospiraceae bacterium]